MRSSVFWALVRKDLYLMRGFIIATIAAGVLAVVLMKFGKVGFAVGGILFLTANVASGIFIAMYTLFAERKDLSRQFGLSLPISGFRYDLVKLLSGFMTFGIPWFVLTLIALGIFLLPGVPDRGMFVYALMLQGFVMALFSVVMAAMFVIKSETMSGVVILVVNICFSLFMVSLNQPQITAPMHGPTIVWTSYSLTMLAGEVLAIALSLAFTMFSISRKRDYI